VYWKCQKLCITPKRGLKKLQDELDQLISVERPLVSQQIADARDKGDLSENAEYDAAKNEQAMLELKISKLQEIIRNARLIDESKMDSTKVLILSTVKIKNLKNNMVMTYTLVPENEANIKEGKISVSSPIAKGLLGLSVGDKVDIDVPAGKMTFEIIEIQGKINFQSAMASIFSKIVSGEIPAYKLLKMNAF
jgi:transcription elongation factor GreA